MSIDGGSGGDKAVETTRCSGWLIYEKAADLTMVLGSEAGLEPFLDSDGFEVTIASWAADGGVRTTDNERRSIPLYVIQSAAAENTEDHPYAVVRSNNDYQYAESLPEANEIADDMRNSSGFISPTPHTVQVVELQESPPDA